MKVKSTVTGFDLTEGKIYEVISEYDTVYLLKTDTGTYCRNKDFFEIVNEDENVEEEKKCMKTMKKFSLMKLVDLVQMFLEILFMMIGLGLLLYPQEMLDQMYSVLIDPAMRNSRLFFPMLWAALSLVQIMALLIRLFRKKFAPRWKK